MKKICDQCCREYYDEDDPLSPADELGRIFLETMQERDTVSLCPECREKLGIVFLLGFGE